MSNLGKFNEIDRTFMDCSTTITDAASQISNEVRSQLDCTFVYSAKPVGSSNDELWNDIWKNLGSCTGFTPAEYFRLMTVFYNQHNPNTVMKTFGVTPPTVDRNTFLNQMYTAWGKQAWIECDDNLDLTLVVVCFSFSYPHDLVDCPFDPYATSGNGAKCSGTLNLITSTAVPPTVSSPLF